MGLFSPYIIKSFKHDGHLHRTWHENWLVPLQLLDPSHQKENITVLINHQTRIQEADGKEWVSKIPGVSFFIPKEWYNIVALIEDEGVRYYCNIASPPYLNGQAVTYIDYDLDVIIMPDGQIHVVDQEEYEHHKALYRYSDIVINKVGVGLDELLQRINDRNPPFQDNLVRNYFELWKKREMG